MSQVIPEGWKLFSIDDFLDFSSLFCDGDWVESKDQDTEGGNRLIQLADIGDGIFLDKSNKYMNDKQFRRLNCTELKEGDILIARMPDPLGRSCLFPQLGECCATVVDVAILRSPTADKHWLMYMINSHVIRRQIESLSAGTTRTRISRKLFGRVLFPTPSISDQKRIADILQAIDRAIAHTEALIEKYHQIKAGLMHDLFTRGIGADGKLRPTREEAPELYQESAIGWIPREWELKPLEYGLSASPKNGYSPKEVENWQGVYVLGLSCLTKNGFSPAHLKNAPKTALRSSAKLEDGDFLISRSNTQELVGLCGIYRDIGHDTIYPDLMMKLRLNRNVVAEFLEQYLLSQATRQRISAIAVGTSGSMVKINATTLKSLKVVYPDPSEQKEIVNKLRPIMNHILCLETQLNKLQKQKSGLMHDLLTGKVPVKVNPDEVDHISN